MFNYDFPIIASISDILPHIQDKDEFIVSEKDGYTVINYAVAFEETFVWDDSDPFGSAIRRECRGLIFNKEGELISRPYHKFFNVGEREETQIHKINLCEPHVTLEKLDGSMIRPIPTPEGFRLATKAGITEVSEQAEKFISNKWIPTNELYSPYHSFINKCLQKGTTPIFEWCSRKNRIVIDYPEDCLILTVIRNNLDGSYVNYKTMVQYAKAWNIPVVKAIAGDETNITKVVDHIRKWDDGEGVVIRFDNGHMVKIKADDYILRHKAKESINQEKNVIAVILEDSVDDLIPLLTESDAKRLREFQKAFWSCLDETAANLADIFNEGHKYHSDQKDFAVNFVQKMVPNHYAPVMYQMKAGRGSKSILIDMIKKSLCNTKKRDQNRWIYGNLNWYLN